MRLEAAQARASAANEAGLAAEKAKDAAEEEVEALRRVLDPKRARGEATTTEETEGLGTQVGDWDLCDHRREMSRVSKRRAVELGSRESARAPRTGQQGYLHHARTGLVGAVAYWACGSLTVAVTMIVALVVHLKIADRVRDALPQSAAQRDAETEHEICNNLRVAFSETKHCRSEGQRIEHGTLAAAVACARDSSMIGRIGKLLGLHWGTRSIRAGEERGRPTALDAAIDRRAKFKAVVALHKERLKEGDTVLSHGDLCKLTRICGNWDDCGEGGPPCVLTFRDIESGAEEEKTYQSMFGKQAGSARLQRPPPTLAPPPRATRKDATSSETRAKIRTHTLEVCATSPHTRDQKRQHVGARLWVTRPALILLMPIYAMFGLFCAAHPEVNIKESQYRSEFAQTCWEAIHAYREGCLCKACFNYRCYREALAVVAQILSLLLEPQGTEEAGDDDAHADAEAAEFHRELKALIDFCLLTLMSAVGNEMVCAPCLQDADAKCLRGECNNCGFRRLWTKGIRPKLVFTNGKLKPGVSRVWTTKMMWDRVKSGGDGGTSEDDLRQRCEGTLIELLDQFEPVQDKWTPHRYLIVHTKVAAKECDQHTPPGVIVDNSDWSENGEIVRKRAMQYEYWDIRYYSLLISIVGILLTGVWKDRRSPLSQGTEVTVEPTARPLTETHEQGITPIVGSYFAVIDRASTETGEAVEYVVKRPNGDCITVRRELLRHRKWHRMAFLQFTNDKQHDGWSTQAFASRRHHFFQMWNDRGHAAAVAFALDDMAERRRVEEQAALDTQRAAATAVPPVAAAPTEGIDVDHNDDVVAAAAARAAAAAAHADAEAAAIAAVIAAAASKPSAYSFPVPNAARRQPSDAQFAAWRLRLNEETFWAWVQHADNAVHFKSKENMYFWSTRLGKVDFMKAIWIEFGCPGHGRANEVELTPCTPTPPPIRIACHSHPPHAHCMPASPLMYLGDITTGKGPWDGMGAMVKTKVTRDITHEQCRTPSGRIEAPIDVAQHTRATFCTQEWLQAHAYMQIHEIIVMYLDTAEIARPRVPPTISSLPGIQSLYSFFVLGDGLLCTRTHSCWCPACACVRSRTDLIADWGGVLKVAGCTRTNLTVWRAKPRLTSTAAAGIASQREYIKELWARLRRNARPGKFAWVQVDRLWSESERKHLRPGHGWVCELGDAGGDKGCIKESFSLPPRSWKQYESLRFYDGEAALVVRRWFHRTDDDASGCTFVEQDLAMDAAPGAPQVAMIISSSTLRGVFGSEEFKKIPVPALNLPVVRTRGAAVRQLQGVGEDRYGLHIDTDTEMRDRTVAAGSVL